MWVAVSMSVPFLANAEGANDHNGMYATFGGGTLEFKGIKPSKFEKKLIANSNFTTTATMRTESSNWQTGIGYHFNKYVSFEGTYIDGVSISTQTTIVQYNGTTLDIEGNTIVVSPIPLNIMIRREATLSATQAVVLLKYPIMDGRVNIFVRPSVTKYGGTITYKLYVPNKYDLYVSKSEQYNSTAIAMSFGVDYHFAKNWVARIEYLGLGSKKVKMLIGVLEYQF